MNKEYLLVTGWVMVGAALYILWERRIKVVVKYFMLLSTEIERTEEIKIVNRSMTIWALLFLLIGIILLLMAYFL